MEYAVVKMGGSLLSPKDAIIDPNVAVGYVKEILKFYSSSAEEKRRLILLVGGGNVSRRYRDTAKQIGEDSNIDLHRIGMTVNWANAELIRASLDDIAYETGLGVGVYVENRSDAEKMMERDFEKWLASDTPAILSGGFINGASTDFNAVLLASKIGVDTVVKLTNVDYVYTADPSVKEDAEPIKDLSWTEFLRLFDASFENLEHKPGQNIPVDLFAAKLAHENGIGCRIIDGRDSTVMGAVLEGKTLEGTFIHP